MVSDHFTGRQITLRRCSIGMARPNPRGFDAELFGYESSESLTKLVQCDPFFQAGLLTARWAIRIRCWFGLLAAPIGKISSDILARIEPSVPPSS
jgi:hypothetical protein